MDSQGIPATSLALIEGRFGGRAEFTDLIRHAFAAAAVAGWREIILCDPSFEDWPLGERVVAQALHDWSKTGRKLTMLANSYDEVLRRHARFASWRRTWAHIAECRASVAAAVDDLPSALWAPGWSLERLDRAHCGGVAGPEVVRRVALKERLNEQLLKSLPAFPASTLGL